MRLRRLSPACLRLLGAASTIGDEFSLDDLSVLHAQVYAARDDSVVPTLALLEEASLAGVITPVRRASGLFRFDHGLVRQAFHDDLSPDLRAELHLAMARYHESMLADGLSNLADVAYHYTEAVSLVDRSEVAAWCQKAGDEAMRRLAYEDAAAAFERGLTVLQGGRSSDRSRAHLLRRLGSSQITAGAIETGRTHLREAAAIAEAQGMSDDLAEIALAFVGEGVGVVLFEVGIVDGENVELIERALAGLASGDSAVRAKLMCHLAAASLFSADPDRHIRCAEDAIAMACRLDDPDHPELRPASGIVGRMASGRDPSPARRCRRVDRLGAGHARPDERGDRRDDPPHQPSRTRRPRGGRPIPGPLGRGGLVVAGTCTSASISRCSRAPRR